MFWDRFYELCIKNNTRPNPVCKELGLSTAIATKWKKGFMPSINTLYKISDYFNVPVAYLIGSDEFITKEEKPTHNLGELSEDEINFLLLIRSLSPDEREALYKMIKGLSSNQ